MVKKKVLIATRLNKIAQEILSKDGAYEVIQDEVTPLAKLAVKYPDTYALIVRSERVTNEIIDAMSGLKVIVRAGAGVNTIATKYARKKGIDVMNTPGANANAVAEEVIAMMLADARRLIEADISTRDGKWEKKKFMGREIAGKTVGIVGLGNVGRMLAKRLSGFDVRLLGNDPVISVEKATELGITLVELPYLFAESDYISLHIPENEETKGLVKWELLTLMKSGATIVNCARSGIVVEEDLRRAKKEKGIRYLTDVYQEDGPGTKSVADIADIMLPHIGASTFEANFNAAKFAAEHLIAFDRKGVTSYIVNRNIPEGLDEAYCDLAYSLAKLCRCLAGKNATPSLLETTFYGTLQEYSEWLLVPVVAGISESFDRSMDHVAARKFLKEIGVEYINREPGEQKKYESSITVDLTSVDNRERRHVSIRGTITEGILMISRINEFDRLYLEPSGNIVFFLYDDRPGVLASIGRHLASRNINIEDVRNPHDAKTNRSLATMKVNQPVPEDLIKIISEEIRAISAFTIKL